MKNILFLALMLFTLSSCSDSENYEHLMSTEIIEGKISAVEPGHAGRVSTPPVIYVQDAKSTKRVVIPFRYDGRWKVGDSCLLIIEHYRVTITETK